MRNYKGSYFVLALLMGLIFTVAALAQDQEKKATETATKQTSDQVTKGTVESGRKQKISGIIVKRDGNDLVVRDRSRSEFKVNFSNSTKIEERKSNPFRGARKYDADSLVRGLWVEVEGRGDSGALVADKIKFTENEYRDAASLETRVDPVEDRVGETENRVSQAEQNQQRLSGQLEELAAVANTAKGGAKAAQDTADRAISEVNAANERINQTNQRVASVDERVSSMDDYEPKNTTNINFKVRSAALSADSKTALDEVANIAKNEKGYVIQIAGYASADGSTEANRRLSERRANAVIRYLIENHDIPQRRIITPYGFGELKPAGDNATREGREQNRRVEVAVLVSKGMSGSSGDAAQRPRTTSIVPNQQ